MASREVFPAEYDTLEQELEKVLPFSLCAFVHFKLMRTRNLLVEKKILVNCWPEPSVVVIVDSKNRGILPHAVIFCKGPGFVQTLETLLQLGSKHLAPPISVVGCSSDVRDALVSRYESANACPFKGNCTCGNALVYMLPVENIVPLTIPNGFKISELRECHKENVCKSWKYGEEFQQFCSLANMVSYLRQFQTVCIETDEGRPVAWQMQQEYGGIGMLHVEPEFRRKKLGSIVTRALAEKIKKEDNLVFACVDESNKASIMFHEKNGFVRLPFRICFMGYFLEKKLS